MSGQSKDGGDEGEAGEERSSETEEVTGGPSHVETGHDGLLTWSDLSPHSTDAALLLRPSYYILQSPLTTLTPPTAHGIVPSCRHFKRSSTQFQPLYLPCQSL